MPDAKYLPGVTAAVQLGGLHSNGAGGRKAGKSERGIRHVAKQPKREPEEALEERSAREQVKKPSPFSGEEKEPHTRKCFQKGSLQLLLC